MACSCVCKICQNVRTGGSDQPPVAGSELECAQRPCEPVGERETDPVSSSTRTVARALSPNRARKGVDDGTNRSRCRRHRRGQGQGGCMHSLVVATADFPKYHGGAARSDPLASQAQG